MKRPSTRVVCELPAATPTALLSDYVTTMSKVAWITTADEVVGIFRGQRLTVHRNMTLRELNQQVAKAGLL